MLGVGDRVTDNLKRVSFEGQRMQQQLCTYTLKEELENATRLLVDKTRDTLHTPTAGKTADSLDIINQFRLSVMTRMV